jgi:hypothetical protein
MIGKQIKKISYTVIIACAAIILLFLTSKYIFLDSDAVSYFYTNAYSLSHNLNVPWNSGILGGFLGAASFQYGFFNPIYRLFYGAVGFVTAYNWMILFYISLASFITYLFSIRLGLSKSAAIFSAISFGLAQTSTHWASNIAVISSVASLPAAFLAVRAAFFGPKWDMIVFALIFGLSFLGAHQQFILMSLVAAGLYGLYLTWAEWTAEKTVGSVIKPWLVFATGCLAALAIGFPQLYETIKFTPISTRTGGLDWAHAAIDAATPLDLIKYLLPNFNFRYGISAEFLPYAGIMALLLAIAAMRKKFADRRVRFFVGLLLFALIASMKYSPVFWLMNKMPVLQYFRGPARWTFVCGFALAILAGLGLEHVVAEFDKTKNFLKRIAGWILSATAFVWIISNLVQFFFGAKITLMLQNWFDANMYARTTGLPVNYYHNVIKGIIDSSFANFSISNPRFMIPFAFMLLTFLTIKYVKKPTRFAEAAIIISFCNLFAVGCAALTFADAGILRDPPAIAKQITSAENDPFSYRIFSFLTRTAGYQNISAVHNNPGNNELTFSIDGLAPNTNIFWGIQSIDGYEPMALARGQRVLAHLGSETNQYFPSLANEDVPLQEKISKFISRTPLLSMLNVKYVVSAYDLGKTEQFDLINTIYSTKFSVPLYLYKNNEVLPRIYLADGIKYLTTVDDAKNLQTIIESSNDFSKTTFIECADCQEIPSPYSDKDKIEIKEYRAGFANLQVNTTSSRWLIFGEYDLPGWIATVDGSPAEIYNANYILQGLFVPAGKHEVVFEYKGA